MNFFDAETAKVNGAAALGISTGAVNVLLKNLEPIMNFLIQAGQVAIAVFTVLYLYRKWRMLSRKKKKGGS